MVFLLAGCGALFPEAEISIRSFEMVEDENGDGRLNQGEWAVLHWEVEVSPGWNDEAGATIYLDGAGQLQPYDTRWDFSVTRDERISRNVRIEVPDTVSGPRTYRLMLAANIQYGDDDRRGMNLPLDTLDIVLAQLDWYVANDENAKIDPGEQNVAVVYRLVNSGSSPAQRIYGWLHSEDAYLTDVTPAGPTAWEGIGASDTSEWNFLRLWLDGSTPASHTVTVTQTLKDDRDRVWTVPLAFPVNVGPEIALAGFELREKTGDGDAAVEPGEVFHILLELENRGNHPSLGFSASLSDNDGNISWPQSVLTALPGLEPDSSMTTPPHELRVFVESSHPGGEVPVNLVVEDKRGNSWSESFSFTVTP